MDWSRRDRLRRRNWGVGVLSVVRQAVGFPRVAVAALVLLVMLGATAPVATAGANTLRPASQGSGLGSPWGDSTAPQILPGAKVAVVRAWTEHAIAIRLRALRGADSAATAKGALTASDRSVVVAEISTERSGLNALETSVRSDNDLTQLQSAIDAMITDYRVFTVVVPQVNVMIELDASEPDVARLTRTEAEISAAVTTASALGNEKAAQRYYSSLVAELQSARGLLQSTRSAVLSAVPSSYPGAAQTLASAAGSVSLVRADIGAARSDIEIIAQLLRKKAATTQTFP
jgi:hypothetical protein